MSGKRILKAAGWTALVLLGLVLLGVAGGILFIRSSVGERWLADTAISVLDKSGIHLSVKEVAGPLPQRLFLKDVRLADAQGVWLTIPECSIQLRLSALLRGQLVIENLTVLSPELLRLPVLPPSEPAPPSEPLSFLKPEGLESLASTFAGIAKHITLNDLKLDRLRIEKPVVGTPLAFSLAGTGPLTDWHGTLKLEEAVPEGWQIQGELLLGNQGSWLTTPLPDAAVSLHLDGRLHGKPYSEVSSVSFADLSKKYEGVPDVELQTLVSLRGPLLSLDWFDAAFPGGQLRIRKGVLSQKKLGGALSVFLDHPSTLSTFLSSVLSPVSLPFDFASLDVELSGSPENPSFMLHAGIEDIFSHETPATHESESFLSGTPVNVLTQWQIQLEEVFHSPRLRTKGALYLSALRADNKDRAESEPENAVLAELGETGLAVHIQGEAAKEGDTLSLPVLLVQSRLLLLSGAGSMDQRSGKAEAKVRLDIPELGVMAELEPVASLLAASSIQDVAGRVQFEGNVRRETSSTAFTGALELVCRNMRWGMERLQSLLGNELRTACSFSFLASKEGILGEVKDAVFRAGSKEAVLTADGNVRLDVPALGPNMVSESQGKIDAEVRVEIGDLASVTSAVSGGIQARLQAHGPLSGADVRVEVSSPSVHLPSAVLENVQFQLRSSALGREGGKGILQLDSTVIDTRQKDKEKPSIPVHFITHWDIGTQTFALQSLRLQAPGLELEGELRGDFHSKGLDGALALSVKDWSVLAALGGIPLQGEPARLNLRLRSTPKQLLAADWTFGSLDMGTFGIRRFQGKASVEDLFVSPVLALTSTWGAGNIADFTWNSGKASINGRERFQIAALLQGQLAANIRTELSLSQQQLALQTLELSVQPKPQQKRIGVRLVQPSLVGFKEGNLSVNGLSLAVLPEGSFSLQGHSTAKELSFEAVLKGIPLSLARQFTTAPTPDGILEGRLFLQGTPERPQGTLRIIADHIRYPETALTPATVQIDGKLVQGAAPHLEFALEARGLGTTPATGHAVLPVRFTGGIPELVSNRPLEGSLFWNGPLAPLWQFVPLANSTLTGQGHLEASLSGTLEAPQGSAQLQLRGAQFEDILAGFMLTDINTDIELNPYGSSRVRISAGDGQGGSLRVNGTVGALNDGLPLQLRGEVLSLSPLHRADLNLTLSGSADITGPVTQALVKAALVINNGSFQIVRSFGTNIPTLNVVDASTLTSVPAAKSAGGESSSEGPVLDVTVTLPNQFFVRGKGLESEWKGRLQVTGPVSNPSITGQLVSIRGVFGLIGKEFTLTKGVVNFSGATPPDPLLDIVVSYNAPNITAMATVSGTATSPSLTLSSQPPLPQDEIVAQVLFGKSSSSLSRVEAIQLAAEVGMLAGFGNDGPNLFNEARSTFGLDVLRFGSIQQGRAQQRGRPSPFLQPGAGGNSQADDEENAVPALEVGKYVMDNVYVGLEQGMNGDTGGVRVEIDLTPHFSIEGSSTPQGSEIGASWKLDY